MTTQEKLEAFAPYYPHELKVITFLHNIYTVSFDLDVDVEKCVSPQDVIKFNLKPILRPLSDLIKPCLKGGKVPIDCINEELVKINGYAKFDYLGYKDYCHRFIYYDETHAQFALPYFIVKMMLKWHFWLGDQSEFGKSIIDINTIKTE